MKILVLLAINCYKRFSRKLAMRGYADILFGLKRAICSIFHKSYLLKNIISCYLTVSKEICAKYQSVHSKLKFCYQNLKI